MFYNIPIDFEGHIAKIIKTFFRHIINFLHQSEELQHSPHIAWLPNFWWQAQYRLWTCAQYTLWKQLHSCFRFGCCLSALGVPCTRYLAASEIFGSDHLWLKISFSAKKNNYPGEISDILEISLSSRETGSKYENTGDTRLIRETWHLWSSHQLLMIAWYNLYRLLSHDFTRF